MRIAYFFNYQLPGQEGSWLVPGSAVDHLAPKSLAFAQAQSWQDELTRHQAIYEELLASPDWAGQAAPPRPAPRHRAPSARALTRDLAGWSLPQPGQWPAAKS
jgi:hypothetical protein